MNWLASLPPSAERSGTNLAPAEGCLPPCMHVDRSRASIQIKHKRSVKHILQVLLGKPMWWTICCCFWGRRKTGHSGWLCELCRLWRPGRSSHRCKCLYGRRCQLSAASAAFRATARAASAERVRAVHGRSAIQVIGITQQLTN